MFAVVVFFIIYQTFMKLQEILNDIFEQIFNLINL